MRMATCPMVSTDQYWVVKRLLHHIICPAIILSLPNWPDGGRQTSSCILLIFLPIFDTFDVNSNRLTRSLYETGYLPYTLTLIFLLIQTCVCIWKNGKETVECINRDLGEIPQGVEPSTQVTAPVFTSILTKF